MTLSEQLKKTVECLQTNHLNYALAGGIIASLYRQEERLTKDLDFIIATKETPDKTAKKLLENLGMDPICITQAEMQGGPLHAIRKKNTPTWMVCGVSKDPDQIRVDFLLLGIPWIEKAIERAAFNQIDFGFSKIPSITKEDFIISKLYSFSNRSDRFKDLDDLQSVFRTKLNLDLNYLTDRMKTLNLQIPDLLKKEAPKELLKLI